MKNLQPWTIALIVLIVLDSIVTTIIGTEDNWMIIWVMTNTQISLSQAMFFKVIFCLPLVLWLDRTDYTKLTAIAYIGIYLVLTAVQPVYVYVFR